MIDPPEVVAWKKWSLHCHVQQMEYEERSDNKPPSRRQISQLIRRLAGINPRGARISDGVRPEVTTGVQKFKVFSAGAWDNTFRALEEDR